jgi:hypothetical protein
MSTLAPNMNPADLPELIGLLIAPFVLLYLAFIMVRGLIRNVFYLRPPKEEVEAKAQNNAFVARLVFVILIIIYLAWPYLHYSSP